MMQFNIQIIFNVAGFSLQRISRLNTTHSAFEYLSEKTSTATTPRQVCTSAFQSIFSEVNKRFFSFGSCNLSTRKRYTVYVPTALCTVFTDIAVDMFVIESRFPSNQRFSQFKGASASCWAYLRALQSDVHLLGSVQSC